MFGRNDPATGKLRNVAWITPSYARSINGISIGPFLSGMFFGGTNQTVNGLAIDIVGEALPATILMGPFAPLAGLSFPNGASDSTVTAALEADDPDSEDFSLEGTTVNGLLISAGGPIADRANGVSVSPYIGMVGRSRGVFVNALWSMAGDFSGVTVGAFNNVRRGRGVIIGGSIIAGEIIGLQLGGVNRAVRTRGVQIGLLNNSQKRTLPFINWGFEGEWFRTDSLYPAGCCAGCQA